MIEEQGVTARHTKAEMQVEAVEALLQRQASMSRLGFSDDFMTVGVGEVRGAMAEAAARWERIEQGLPAEYSYTDPSEMPPPEMLREGQVWVWLTGPVPHWEIKGTGVVMSDG